jgi:hypothetical protein
MNNENNVYLLSSIWRFAQNKWPRRQAIGQS